MGRAHGREDRAAHRDRAAPRAARSCTSSTPPARASPTRSSCSPAGAARGGSSPTRCGSPAGCRRCAACSARRPRAARTSPRSATSCSWSRRTPRCTSARRGWPRRSSARTRRSRRWAARACTRRSAAAATTSCTDDDEAIDAAKRWLSYLPAVVAGARPGRSPRTRPGRRRKPIATTVPVEERRGVRHAQGDRRDRRRGVVLRDQAAVRPGAGDRLRPARRRAGRDRRQQPDAPRRRAVRRQRRQGGPVHLAVRRVQRAAAVPRRRARAS